MRTRLVGAAGLAVTGVAVTRQVARRRQEQAVARAMLEPGPLVELRGEPMRLPVMFQRSDGFAAIFGAELERVAAILPSDAIHPVRLDRDRAAVIVAAYRHHEPMATMASGETRVARPYGELMVAALVTPRPAPPVLPLLATSTFRVGGFVLHLPVTSRLAMDAGRLWNYPKFVADMDFTIDPDGRSVTVGTGGHRVLTLAVRPRGRPTVDRSPTVLYSERDGTLLELAMPTVQLHQVRLGQRAAELELGDHEVAAGLRAIGLGGPAFGSMTVITMRFAMTAGHAIGPARPYHGYAGVERDFGRYTVRHAGMPAIDQYAGLTDEEWVTVPVGQPVETWQATEPPATVEQPGTAAAGRGRKVVAAGR
jgi:hypothetical protein